ncbi:hypothetical protein [Sphingobacterium chuzhouense]|uniref:Lipoprotein n=1 Tax=Sphingobacterium chuzhouense TaxID=1742264 RepID=A0ABR7XUZ5_9SPHI|nr:hypothetical protein [Sphingobacterium chuzhouense]MBD1422871.1 hypothetical protein [Sphingobacterium chuzhouense]
MIQINCFIIGIISMGLVSCQQQTKDKRMGETIADSTSEVLDTLSQYDTIISVQDSDTSLNQATVDTPPKFTIREGVHNLSLQWISWEEMGEAEIKYLGDNVYNIEGEQQSSANSDYLKLKGTLEPISENELIFDGIVEHQITHLNQGQPCVKKGKQIFKSTKNRRYWRMQDMQNCEGGSVTDYIDIYF